jgi:hypothetical protein
VEITDRGKHSSLLRYGKITAVKSFVVQAAGEKDKEREKEGVKGKLIRILANTVSFG